MGFWISAKLTTLGKHFPRNHLMLASVLSLVLVMTLVFAPEESAHGARINATPTLPSTDEFPLDSNTATAATATPLSDRVISNESTITGMPEWTELEVQSGDNLSALFTKVGLSAQDMYKVLNSNDEAKILNRLYPGYQLSFHIPEAGKLAQLKVLKSPLEGYLFTLNDSSYQVEPIIRTAELRPSFKEGVINDSLFMAAKRADIPAASIMEMADIFGGVIDFILDPRDGDDFSILYEEQYLDGQFIGNGDIIAAQFTNQGKQFVAVRYINEDGEVGYYSPEGESMRKAFLRTPLDVFRISSNFSLNRKHPILNTIRAHKGTDYAAPKGTPVRATSDGVVTWAARNGSFGKLVVLQHRGQFETKYAHLNDYASGIKKGARVRQGQIIGYVGQTGGATGPHLHYEFLIGGVHKDPRTIVEQLPQAISLAPEELPRFKAQAHDLLQRFQKESVDSRLLSANLSQGIQTH
jgi:murein DD-endopeptidase MepM/ murein hydrolase activator NlpD